MIMMLRVAPECVYQTTVYPDQGDDTRMSQEIASPAKTEVNITSGLAALRDHGAEDIRVKLEPLEEKLDLPTDIEVKVEYEDADSETFTHAVPSGTSAPDTSSLDIEVKVEYEDDFSSCTNTSASGTSAPAITSSVQPVIDEGPHRCEMCNKTFSSSYDLARHRKTHVQGRSFQCMICGEIFAKLDSLKSHQRTNHKGAKSSPCTMCYQRRSRCNSEEMPIKCFVCDRSFPPHNSLAIHRTKIYTESNHKCAVCHLTFTRDSDLQRHQRTHAGEKPHECPVCNRGFDTSGGLTKHMRRAHKEETPLLCSVCNETFTRSKDLEIHKRTHIEERPFHIEERPFPCNVCSKTFTNASGLIRHNRRSHKKEKPPQCTVLLILDVTNADLSL